MKKINLEGLKKLHKDCCNYLKIKECNLFLEERLHSKIQMLYLDEAGYDYKERTILINPNPAEKWNEFNLVLQLFHETRHAFQHDAIKGLIAYNKENINKWEEEFKNYKRFQDNIEEYYMQAVEVDAIAFSEYYVMLKFNLNIKLKLPKKLRELVEKRKHELKHEKNISA